MAHPRGHPEPRPRVRGRGRRRKSFGKRLIARSDGGAVGGGSSGVVPRVCRSGSGGVGQGALHGRLQQGGLHGRQLHELQGALRMPALE